MSAGLRRVILGIAAALSPVVASAASAVYSLSSCTNNVVAASLSTTTPNSISSSGAMTAVPPVGLALDGWYMLTRLSNSTENLNGTNGIAASSALIAAYGAQNPFQLDFSSAPLNRYSGIVYLIPAYSWLRYTLRHDVNGGSGNIPAAATYIYTNEVSLAAAPSRTGYVFAGWNTKANGSGSTYSAGQRVTGATFGATAGSSVNLYAKWTPATYAVTLNANANSWAGAKFSDGATTKQISVTYGGTYPDTPVPECQGYSFKNWYDGTAKTHFPDGNLSGRSVAITSSRTFWAQYVVNKYPLALKLGSNATRIRYKINGATSWASTATNITVQVEYGSTFYACAEANQGYTPNYPESNPYSAVMQASAKTVTLNVTANTYTVTLNRNGGTGGTTSATATYGSAMPGINVPTLAGCAFGGYWDTDATTGGTQYYRADGTSARSWNKTSSTTLYARWQGYTVSFNAHGGSACQAVVGKGTLPATERTGYKFAGWYTAAEGGTRVGGAGNSYTPAADITLHAHWTANVYELAFDNLFIRDAWRSSASCALRKEYTGGAALVINSTTGYWPRIEAGGDTNVYTKYGAGGDFFAMPVSANTEYTVSCSLSGGAASSAIFWVAQDSSGAIIKTDAGADYRALGRSNGETSYTRSFRTPAGCAYIQILLDVANSGETETFMNIRVCKTDPYASVTVNPTVRDFQYNDNGTTTYGTLPTPVRAGYTFLGWFTKESGGTQVTANSVVQPQHAVLYSHWEERAYTIRYNANGGTGTMADQALSYTQTAALSSNAFTRAGYVFAGWNTDAGGTGTAYADGATVSRLAETANAVFRLYAQWSPISYTVAFDAGGGEGSAPSAQHDYGEVFQLPANTFSKTGYTFQSWTNSAGVAFLDGATVSNLTTDAGATVTLFARWAANGYTVRYDPNGATGGSMDDTSATYDVPFDLRPNGYSLDGVSFAGWTNSTGEVFLDGATVTNLTAEAGATVTLYATWADSGWNFMDALDIDASVRNSMEMWSEGSAWTVHVASNEDEIQPQAGSSYMTAASGGGDSSLFMKVNGGGILSFYWTAQDSYIIKRTTILKFYVDEAQPISGLNGDNENWVARVTVDLTGLEGEHVFRWTLVDRGLGDEGVQTVFLDKVTWQPAGTAVEPTEADRPVITRADMSSGDFSLSFQSSGAFRYVLEASDSLTPPAWTDIRTNDVSAAGESVSFGELYDGEKPQRFFRVRVEGLGTGETTP